MIFECIDCHGQVKQIVKPEPKKDICTECGKDKLNNFPYLDYIGDNSISFKCEKCERIYTGEISRLDTNIYSSTYIPSVELKEYNFSKEKKNAT